MNNKLLEDITPQSVFNMLINLNRLQLNEKPHIKKYNRLRKVHSEILDSMKNYILSGKYDVSKFNIAVEEEVRENVRDLNFDLNDPDDISIFIELFIYDNHPDVKSVTDIYLKKKKFKNQEKMKLLKAMKDSYVSLFKVVDVDSKDGYVTYQDVFSDKKFKIIDISMSSTLQMPMDAEFYTYNRIITVDGISFATGIHCNFSSKCKAFMNFLKTGKYKNCSSFVRCLLFYDIYIKESDVISDYHHEYGN